MKIKPRVKKYPGGGKINQLSDFTPVFHNSNETIQQKIKNQNEYQQTDAYTKQLALKAVQDAEEANRKKYVPSQAVKNTKALNAVGQLIQPYNPYFKAIGTGGDIETAIKYGIDGQYDKMKEDLVQAGLQWIPFMKGSPAMKQGTYNLSTLQNLFNFGLSTTQKGSDAKTVTEVFKNGGSIKKYPNGGRQPIVVNDKNDPRLQAYSDSLETYNKLSPMFDRTLGTDSNFWNPKGRDAYKATTLRAASNDLMDLYVGSGLDWRINPGFYERTDFSNLNSVNVPNRPIKPVQSIIYKPKQQTTTLPQLNQNQLPETNTHLEFDPIGLKKGTYFTRPRQQQEAGQGNVDYFDNKTGKLLKTMEFGGKTPKYEWSKGIDNIQPITQTQNNSSITTGNKKLSTEELKKAAEYTKKYNQQHLEEEYNNRQNKLKQSIDAQKQPLSLKNLQTQTQSTGDKFSLAMNTKYGNPKDYPTLSGYIQGLDYINPFKMIGDMASGLGSVPQDIKQGNYLKAGLSVASPLAVGAIAGVGANGVKPFVNNLANPFAGTKEIVNNLDNKYLPKFKSEINWSKWNKEIPDNPQLMQEYNTIEQKAKANNTWMKNPDGSEFQGTPEQFVQQNSENFKKAFPEGSNRVYRGGNNENFSNDRGHPIVFTADKETARNYVGSVSPFTGDYELASPDAIGGRVLFDMYHPKNSSNLIINNQGKSWREISRNHFGENSPVRDLHNTKGDFTSTDDIAKWMVANDKNSVRLNNIFDSYDAKFVDIVNHKQGNYLKSATSNNGMFDMTNPNIYKALVPGVIGLGAASQIDKKQNGGNITRESDKPIKYGYGGSVSYKDFKKKYKDL